MGVATRTSDFHPNFVMVRGHQRMAETVCGSPPLCTMKSKHRVPERWCLIGWLGGGHLGCFGVALEPPLVYWGLGIPPGTLGDTPSTLVVAPRVLGSSPWY